MLSYHYSLTIHLSIHPSISSNSFILDLIFLSIFPFYIARSNDTQQKAIEKSCKQILVGSKKLMGQEWQNIDLFCWIYWNSIQQTAHARNFIWNALVITHFFRLFSLTNRTNPVQLYVYLHFSYEWCRKKTNDKPLENNHNQNSQFSVCEIYMCEKRQYIQHNFRTFF